MEKAWRTYLKALNKYCDAEVETARHTREAGIQADISGNYAAIVSDYTKKQISVVEKVLK
jgi:hypothetical protein